MNIQTAKRLINECGLNIYPPSLHTEVIDVLNEALDKQIAKKRVLQDGGHGKCPSCGSFGIAEYCILCGQKIDWSE